MYERVGSHLPAWKMKSQGVTIRTKATEKYFHVVLFITPRNVVLAFESQDGILKSDYSNESYWAVISCGSVQYVSNIFNTPSFHRASGKILLLLTTHQPENGKWKIRSLSSWLV